MSRSRYIRRKSNKPRLYSCSHSPYKDALMQLNNIDWNITDFPDDVLSYKILDYPWCSGELKLLLPIMPVQEDSSMIVYFQLKINKRKVSVSDILYTIWRFYNEDVVEKEDLAYAGISNSMKSFAAEVSKRYNSNLEIRNSLRFVHFVGKQTKFKSLKYHEKNIYILQLAD